MEPAMMPGGDPEAYALVEPIFTKIAAQVDGTPCVSHIGPDGAGPTMSKWCIMALNTETCRSSVKRMP